MKPNDDNFYALKIGELLEVQSPSPRGPEIHQGRIAGLSDDQIDLIVSAPDDQTDYLKRGSSIALVKKTERGVFVLDSRVIDKKTSPRLLLMVWRSGKWHKVQRRQTVRMRARIRVSRAILVHGDAEEEMDAELLNISAGGVLLRTKKQLAEGSRVKLQFALPDGVDPIDTEVEVLRINDDFGQYYNAGARFVRLKLRQETRIVRFIFNEEAKARRTHSSRRQVVQVPETTTESR